VSTSLNSQSPPDSGAKAQDMVNSQTTEPGNCGVKVKGLILLNNKDRRSLRNKFLSDPGSEPLVYIICDTPDTPEAKSTRTGSYKGPYELRGIKGGYALWSRGLGIYIYSSPNPIV